MTKAKKIDFLMKVFTIDLHNKLQSYTLKDIDVMYKDMKAKLDEEQKINANKAN